MVRDRASASFLFSVIDELLTDAKRLCSLEMWREARTRLDQVSILIEVTLLPADDEGYLQSRLMIEQERALLQKVVEEERRTLPPPSRTLVFYGSSDDTFGYEDSAGPGDDHDDCASRRMRVFKIRSPGVVDVFVIGHYGPQGWMIGFAVDEQDGKGVLPFPYLIAYEISDLRYSPRVTVRVPQDAVVSFEGAFGAFK